jgi:hypothetical protein
MITALGIRRVTAIKRAMTGMTRDETCEAEPMIYRPGTKDLIDS